MSKLTRGNIAYDFKTSPFKVSVLYDDKIIDYIFSSKLNIERFENRCSENRKTINESISNRFKMNINLNLVADLKLYTQVEKRGFLLKFDGESVDCLNFLELHGIKINKKH